MKRLREYSTVKKSKDYTIEAVLFSFVFLPLLPEILFWIEKTILNHP